MPVYARCCLSLLGFSVLIPISFCANVIVLHFVHSFIPTFLLLEDLVPFFLLGSFVPMPVRAPHLHSSELLSRLCSSRKCNDCNGTVIQSCHYTECPEYKTVPTNCRSSSVAKILVWTSHRLCTSMGWALC